VFVATEQVGNATDRKILEAARHVIVAPARSVPAGGPVYPSYSVPDSGSPKSQFWLTIQSEYVSLVESHKSLTALAHRGVSAFREF
jgi:hypothetical protein